MRFVDVTAADDPLLERFYQGIYLGAFATQREPLAAWQAALRGERPYALRVRLAVAGDAIVGGITYELYPRSRVGLVTYMVVATDARERGLGRQLLTDAAHELYRAGARLVVGEVNDPRVHGDAARPRLERFLRWGAQRIDVEYVQPSLGDGLAPDTGLCLIALPPVPTFTRDVVETFLHEFHAALA